MDENLDNLLSNVFGFILKKHISQTHTQAARMRKEKARRAMRWVGEDIAAPPAPATTV